MSAAVTGIATYRERMALPPDAVFEATLADVSRADAPAEVLGRQRREAPGNPPFAIEIDYDPSRVEASHTYAVRATVRVGGELWFTSDSHHPVLTGGHGDTVDVLLRRVSGDQRSAPSLEDTYWKLTSLGDAPLTASGPPREPHLILHPDDHRASGSGGCNRFTGSYELDGRALTFGPIASTMMACAEGMDTEAAFFAALRRVRAWRIATGLELLDADGVVVARFDPVDLA